jgi:hypothetical protein
LKKRFLNFIFGKKKKLKKITSSFRGLAYIYKSGLRYLRRWKKQFETNGNQAFPGKGHMSPEKEELDRLRKEVKKLQMEREILKKAAAFFANESQ